MFATSAYFRAVLPSRAALRLPTLFSHTVRPLLLPCARLLSRRCMCTLQASAAPSASFSQAHSGQNDLTDDTPVPSNLSISGYLIEVRHPDLAMSREDMIGQLSPFNVLTAARVLNQESFFRPNGSWIVQVSSQEDIKRLKAAFKDKTTKVQVTNDNINEDLVVPEYMKAVLVDPAKSLLVIGPVQRLEDGQAIPLPDLDEFHLNYLPHLSVSMMQHILDSAGADYFFITFTSHEDALKALLHLHSHKNFIFRYTRGRLY
mmetsp:Transcript_2872/g.6999  ORF Transcript_2872/g.6999 Transcript_2872/m.6999 type:complete len:260 (-) Transcript_2872:99-878(-)|eukprot:CAMPEP_0177655612 /NCGR_PEP_ID=MMETSP0447-20121125/15075_1 /TAXON_ID=0 /ORGANISM="Stygamoeba regulata, Strain BSH-02190019" /LENGTH=259 /DNA_ID=CAMNT_0019159573 /DNA_START=127 /DNA_END=906 /DNA_ORIENTATION=-